MLTKLASIATVIAITAAAVTACSAQPDAKEEVADETTQAFSLRDTFIAGSLAYGETSALTPYRHTGRTRYVAYKFSGSEGDAIDVWVKSNSGDPVAWVLDNDWRVVAKNDDAAPGNTDAHVVATLPKNASATHYVVVRDYWLDPMSFRVELKGKGADLVSGCNVDSDCAKIEKGCCAIGAYIPVRADRVADYQAGLECPQPLFCPMMMIRDDHSMAQCNAATKKCELVLPKDIACGGFTLNSHQCPVGYSCQLPIAQPDVPGKCVQRCGGFAGIQCSDPDEACVDDPTDTCDPKNGGADCGGICQPKSAPPPPPPPADCRTNGCGTGKFCSFCWGSYQCIPNGAMC